MVLRHCCSRADVAFTPRIPALDQEPGTDADARLQDCIRPLGTSRHKNPSSSCCSNFPTVFWIVLQRRGTCPTCSRTCVQSQHTNRQHANPHPVQGSLLMCAHLGRRAQSYRGGAGSDHHEDTPLSLLGWKSVGESQSVCKASQGRYFTVTYKSSPVCSLQLFFFEQKSYIAMHLVGHCKQSQGSPCERNLQFIHPFIQNTYVLSIHYISNHCFIKN